MDKLQTIKELVNIKSYGDDNTEIIEYLVKKFTPYAKEILKIKNSCGNKNNLIVSLNCELKNAKNPIILSGHIDTVLADEKAYNTNPYNATLIDNKLFGLGVIDMKCFFASIIDKLPEIVKLNYPVLICVTCDEETSFCGIGHVTNVLKENNIVPFYTILGEPTNLKICETSNGCYEYLVEVIGKGCHSSNPKNGINSIYICSKIANFIEKLNKNIKNTTLSCGVFDGGTKVNIVPANASLSFDIRSQSVKVVDNLIKKINKKINKLKREYLGCEIELKNIIKIPALENKNNKITKELMEEFKIDKGEFLGGCEAGYFQELGGESIIFGTGDLGLAHKPNEYLEVDNFEKYNELLVKILEKIINKKTA